MPQPSENDAQHSQSQTDWGGAAAFVLFTVLIAVAYGVLHDLVTAQVSLDYFTVFHPHLVDSQSPFVLALAWGVVATWWVGLIAGIVLALVNVSGKRPPLSWSIVRRRVLISMAILWGTAMTLLAVIYGLAAAMGSKRPPTFEHDRRLIAVAMTHGYSYLGATVITIGLAVWIAFDRAGLHLPPARS